MESSVYKVLRAVLHLEKLNNYPSWVALIGELLGIILSVTIYYYTAMAFSPIMKGDLNFYGTDYFSYVLIGEMGLMIPAYLFANPSSRLKNFISEKKLSSLLSYPIDLHELLTYWINAGILLEVLRVLLHFLIAILFFKLNLDIKGFILMFLIIVISYPIFLGLGLIGAAIIMFFGRGDSILNYITTISLFLAGAYFPTEVFPPIIQKIGHYISPFNSVLIAMRKAFNNELFLNDFYPLIIWILIAYPIGIYLLKYAQNKFFERGSEIILK